MRRAAFLLLVGCGSRTGLVDDGGDIVEDASAPVDTGAPDAGVTCTSAVADVFDRSPGECRMHIAWHCNGNDYSINAICFDRAPSSVQAWCYVNGTQTGSYHTRGECSCDATDVTVQTAKRKCGL